MATCKHKPNGTYSNTFSLIGDSTAHACVDDSVTSGGHDSTSTYIRDGDDALCLLEFDHTTADSGTAAVTGDTINHVTVYAVVDNDSGADFRLVIGDGTNQASGSWTTGTGSFVEYSYQFNTNPAGGSWSFSDLAGLKFGAQVEDVELASKYCQITQIYIEIDYTEGTGETTDYLRIANTLSLEAEEDTRLSHIVTLEVTDDLRLSNIATPDKTELLRLSNILTPEMTEYLRVANRLTPDKFNRLRLSNRLDFETSNPYDYGIFRPTVDDSDTGWNGNPNNTNLYANVDEASASDTDFVSTYVNGIESITFTSTQSGAEVEQPRERPLKIYVRMKFSSGSGSNNVYPRLKDSTGTTYNGSVWSVPENDTYATYSYTWNAPPTNWLGDVTNTTDWGATNTIDFGIYVNASALETLYISQIYIEWQGTSEYLRLSNIATPNKNTSDRLANLVSFYPYDPDWYQPSTYYRRQPISFGTSHEELPSGYTASIEKFTGYEIRVADNGIVNESIGHASRHIAYDPNEDVTYFTWLAQDADVANLRVYAAQYDHATETLSTPVDLVDSGQPSDTHYIPSIHVDASGYIHIFYGAHSTPLKYIRSTNPNDLSSFTTETNLSSDNVTYPRPVEDDSGNIYVFCRGNPGGTYPTEGMGFLKSTDNGATWGSFQKIASFQTSKVYSEQASVYSGGVAYKDGRCHVVVAWDEKYATDNLNRAISYMYSDDFTNWYDINGNAVAVSGSSYLTVNEGVVVTSPNFPNSPYYHTNAEALVVDDNKNPYFTYQDWTSQIREECNLWIAFWNGTSWTKTNLSGLTGSSKMYYYRGGGQLFYDGGKIYAYSFVQPSSTDEYAGADLYRWIGWANGTTWTYDYMTKNTGYGIGMISALPQVYNGKNRELLYSRGRDICYLQDITYPYVRNDGDDLRIIRHQINQSTGGQTDTELDRVPDRTNAEDTKLYFATQSTVPLNSEHPHAYDRYYLYYSAPYATGASNASANVFDFYENFESYTQDTSIHGNGGWTVSGTANFDIFQYESGHPNKLFSGVQSLHASKSYSSYSETVCYRSHTLDSHEITANVWIESATSSFKAGLYIEDTGSGDTFHLAVYDPTGTNEAQYSTNGGSSGSTWNSTGIVASSNQYHELKIKINGDGITCWIDGAITSVVDNTHMTSADRVGLFLEEGVNAYIDHITIKKYVDTPGTVSLGTEEGSDDFSNVRLAHVADLQEVSETRLAHTSTLNLKEYLRLSNISELEAEEAIRIAQLVTPQKTEQLRLAQILAGDKHELLRQAHTLSLEATDVKRIANTLSLDTIRYLRLAMGLSPDKEELLRLANEVGLESTEYERLANITELEESEYLRLAMTLLLQQTYSTRVGNILTPEKFDDLRLSNIADLEDSEFMRIAMTLLLQQSDSIRLSNIISGDKIDEVRLANIADVRSEGQIRIANILTSMKNDVARLANTLGLEDTDTIRVAHLVPIMSEHFLRIANTLILDDSYQIRLANDLNLEKNAVSRIANTSTLIASSSIRLANILNVSVENYLRLSNLLTVINSESMRLANIVLLGALSGLTAVDWSVTKPKLANSNVSNLELTDTTISLHDFYGLSIDEIDLNNPTVDKPKIEDEEINY